MTVAYSFAAAVDELEKGAGRGAEGLCRAVAELRTRHPELCSNSGELHAAVELALRQSLHLAIERGTVDEAEAARVTDAALAAEADGAADGGLPFLLMEDVFESLTLRQCAGVFGVFEARVEQLRTLAESKKPRLRLLHAAVSLLHRLARPASVALKGRVLLFLAKALPLSDKSGLNTRGGSNAANTTEVEQSAAMEVDEGDGAGAAVSAELHAAFWGLQAFFREPSRAVSELAAFEADVTKVLSLFSAVCGSDVAPTKKKMSASAAPFVPAAVAVQSNSEAATTDAMEVDEEGDEDVEQDPFVKYLTAPQLLHLQVQDEHFRRHFLLQLLVLLNTLLRHQQPALGDDQRDALSSLETRAKDLLKKAPDGVSFVNTVEHLLVREAGWIEWKADNCKPFERDPLGADRKEKSQGDVDNKREASAKGATGAEEERILLGNPELTRLWRQEANDSCMATSPIVPSLEEFLQPLADQLEPDSGVEDEYLLKHDKVFVWKSMRLVLKTNHLNYFSKIDGDVEKLVPVIAEEKKAAADALEAGEVAEMDTST